ncbi:MAG: hypothetical protein IIA72_05785 [Proteobacteria bacterium]|nr:hypothetical protein [Pseudomonadota bacterium]
MAVWTATTFEAPGLGFVFILVFGVGSIIGMVALSAVIAEAVSRRAPGRLHGRHSLSSASIYGMPQGEAARPGRVGAGVSPARTGPPV